MVSQQKMKEEEVGDAQQDGGKQPGSPKSRLAMLKRATAKKPAVTADPFRFQGEGVTYKGKLIGVRDVEAARGDAMCADAMRDGKAAVKAAGHHKQRVNLNISLEGIKIKDEKTQTILHNFPVSRISFIARDTTDARAFGFVFSDPIDGVAKYKFYGIKTAQTADHAVLAIRDMFQIVYEIKKKQVDDFKKEKDEKDKKEMEDNGIRSENGVLVADLLDLETELSAIEQGVNQLSSIPVMAGDSWPGEAAHVDPFGQQPFVSPSHDPFGDSFGTDSFHTNRSISFATPQNTSAPSIYPPLLSQSPASMFNTQASPAMPPMGMTPMWSAPSQYPPMGHSYASAPNFSDTNPFASTAVAAGPVVDPFDTSAVRASFAAPTQTLNWSQVNENSAPPNGAPALSHAHSFQANFNDMSSHHTGGTAPTAAMQWEKKAYTNNLDDAFKNLCNMDSLTAPSVMKKNPFEHIINPPKVSLNSLTTGPKSKDPFADDFFN